MLLDRWDGRDKRERMSERKKGNERQKNETKKRGNVLRFFYFSILTWLQNVLKFILRYDFTREHYRCVYSLQYLRSNTCSQHKINLCSLIYGVAGKPKAKSLSFQS
jgi:hypothetical protein